MSREENIRAILECNFSGTKEELIDIAVKNIMALSQEPCEVEATKLQQSYNKGFEDCRQAVLDYGVKEIIQEIKQEPCEDAISREALIAKLTELIKTSRSTIEIKAKLIPMIEQLPSVSTTKNIVNHGTMNITL